jgi:hypothetical protein
MKENTNSEPLCVARARALVDVLNQSDATRRARKAELESLQFDNLLDKKTLDPEEAAQRAGDYARIEMLMKIADRGFAGAQTRANGLAAEIVELIIPVEKKMAEINRANIQAVQEYVTRKIAPWFGEYFLAGAVGQTKIYRAEVEFASNYQGANSYYCDEGQDAEGKHTLKCRSMQGLLRVYDEARAKLAAVEAHADELKRLLR